MRWVIVFAVLLAIGTTAFRYSVPWLAALAVWAQIGWIVAGLIGIARRASRHGVQP